MGSDDTAPYKLFSKSFIYKYLRLAERVGPPSRKRFGETTRSHPAEARVRASASEGGWRAVWDEFRNWVTLGFQPAKRNENL